MGNVRGEFLQGYNVLQSFHTLVLHVISENELIRTKRSQSINRLQKTAVATIAF